MKRRLSSLAAVFVIACSSVPSNVRLPSIIYDVEPYTESSLVAAYNGEVHIEGTVGTDGRLYDARVTSNVIPEIEQAALEAAQGYVFKPGTIDGHPEEMRYRFTIRFTRKTFL
jgi:TonB family protein